MKKIFIIKTSLRKNGNSDRLADAFMKGARTVGNEVEETTLVGKEINFCKGCFACLQTKECAIKDDAAVITKHMKEADVLVFSTPIYYYEMSGQMKTMLDRANPLYGTDFKFREVYLLATAADEEPEAMDKAISGLEGFISCFKDVKLAGVVRGLGVTDVGDIDGNKALDEAYEMGKAITL